MGKMTRDERIKKRVESKRLGKLARIKDIEDSITPNQKYFKDQTDKDGILGV